MKARSIRVLLAVASCSVWAVTAAEKPVKSLKVLAIGNSFSVCTLRQMPQFAKAGDPSFKPYSVSYRPDYLSEADAKLMRECARDAIAAQK